MHNLEDVKSLINQKTKIIWAETPTNPMINVFDISGLAEISKSNNLLFVVDNTFASPYLQNPLDMGADIVMHSATKYLAGHSDVVLGALMLNNDQVAEKLYFTQNASGAVPGPQDCFLTLRGIKTLHVRMQRHCENASKVAHFLNTNPMVEKVYWPGLETHFNHDVAKRQMRNFGGMLSFRIKGYTKDQTIKFLEKLHLFTLAESLGGVESLCGHPATMTHASIPQEEREKSGVTDSLIRLSVGIEDADDLIEDLQKAFL
jgi:cystathionine beta-lyase